MGHGMHCNVDNDGDDVVSDVHCRSVLDGVVVIITTAIEQSVEK